MIKQLLIGGTLAAAAGYTIPGVPDFLNLSNGSAFSSTGAKWESARFSLGNISFTSAFGGSTVNHGTQKGNSITALVEASQRELARKNSNNYAGSAKNLKAGGSSNTGAKFIKN